MADMTDQEMKNINAIWNKVDPKQVGGQALASLLVLHPSSKKYFDDIDDLGSADALSHDAKVKAHGEKLVRSVGEALKNMDNLNEYYAKKSLELRVDPANFENFLGMFIDVMANLASKELTPEEEASFNKAFSAMADAYGKNYH